MQRRSQRLLTDLSARWWRVRPGLFPCIRPMRMLVATHDPDAGTARRPHVPQRLDRMPCCHDYLSLAGYTFP